MLYLGIGIRCLIGVVFGVSAVSKVAGFSAFVQSVRGMRLLPARLVRPVAIFILIAEMAVCPLLLTEVAGLALAAALLAIFAGSVAVAVRRGVRAPCRCFGTSRTPLGPRHVVRNVVLLVVAVVGATPVAGKIDGARAVLAAVCGLVLGGLVIVLDDVVELFQPVGTKEKQHVDRGDRTRRRARRAGPGPDVRGDQAHARAH